MKILAFILVFTGMTWPLIAQVVYTDQDVQLCKDALMQLQSPSPEAPGKSLTETGKYFLGTKYEAHTLDQSEEEKLVIHLSGLDCTTFVENTLALAATLKRHQTSIESMAEHLEKIRYRNGLIEAYPSRLHYFSDWLYENQQNGCMQVITQQIGGKPFEKKIDFMSAHRSLYPSLKDEKNFQEMGRIEALINQREQYYIPKEEVSKIENQIKDGDIIAITTSVKGLDIVHVGFAVMQKGRVHLLHASSEEKKVVISNKPLSDYLLGNKSQSGIMVARVVNL